ncbi:hypothetical protein RRX38_02765 [Pseudomonas sp. DTU_2021_1001937_2_SI_NGA_ILE_001]|uniref:hypothetical protein n=1 Tax=Pseudomonas sp. DTU_2021_1001937_2_SI_NGA_ILE_001 TaxID=3077589 RepID=UPI0028FC0AF3|nr:hypothetical protein [Pseudomonas sp. DTU_2021_1001937_2_SI_NGA_ILE_001]WNW10112.1 hypothetical protein RRX38_02765 [Pseudomonas sp. DTU_2021_1001937_2_SI_NGA_ILE_001]
MRLVSARQAWRDALHESRDSVLAAAAERAKVGKRGYVAGETMPSMLDSNGRCAHMLAAGLVQQAISTLPKPLQHFGHTLYSPVATGQDLNIAHALVWFTAELPVLSAKREEVGYWMALAAIKSHQAVISDREGWGPARVCEFVRDWYGVRISVANWARDWAGIWAAILVAVDQLDAKALRPVAQVVARMDGRRTACRWDAHDRAQVADARAEAYWQRREAARQALRVRLDAMSTERLRRWFARMIVYAAAYRREWGEDVLAKPFRHAWHLDRVAEYWHHRQRLGDVKKSAA